MGPYIPHGGGQQDGGASDHCGQMSTTWPMTELASASQH